MKRSLLLICWVFVFSCFSGMAHATLLHYDINGWGEFPELGSMDIYGKMLISDIGNLEYDLDGDILFATYDIAFFNLTIGSYEFFGSGDDIYMTPSDNYLSLVGSGDWTSWNFDYEEDCRLFGSQLMETMYYCSSIGNNQGIVELNLNLSPVPEPATIILLGAGFIGLAGFRKRLKIVI